MSLWVVETANSRLFEFPDPTNLSVFNRRSFPTDLAQPRGVSFDSSGHMWVVDLRSDSVFEFSDPTNLTSFTEHELASTQSSPQGISFDLSGNMWVVDSSAPTSYYEYTNLNDLTTYTRHTFHPNSVRAPRGVSFDSSGGMWVLDRDVVYQFSNPRERTQFSRRLLANTNTSPQGISFDSDGHMWVVDLGDTDSVFEYPDPTNLPVSGSRPTSGFTRRNFLSEVSIGQPVGISFDDRLSVELQVEASYRYQSLRASASVNRYVVQPVEASYRYPAASSEVSIDTVTGVPEPSAYHTYTIIVGQAHGVTGYWFNNAGSITGATYQLPNGSDAIIRQTMIVAGEIRFVLNQSGLTTSDVPDQFPERIVLTRGSTSTTVGIKSPDETFTAGQGIGRDYIRESGDTLTTVLQNNSTVTVELYYKPVVEILEDISASYSYPAASATASLGIYEAEKIEASYTYSKYTASAQLLQIKPRLIEAKYTYPKATASAEVERSTIENPDIQASYSYPKAMASASLDTLEPENVEAAYSYPKATASVNVDRFLLDFSVEAKSNYRPATASANIGTLVVDYPNIEASIRFPAYRAGQVEVNLVKTTEGKYIFRSFRKRLSNLEPGDPVPDEWRTPIRIAIPTILAQDGEDGIGYEFVFATYEENTLPASKNPSNSWGYNEPGISDELKWFSSAPDTTADKRYLFLSSRIVIGRANTGDNVPMPWSIPAIISHFGIDGQKGEDGRGIEYIYTLSNIPILPNNRWPLNNWGFDEPGTVNGQVWTDGASEPTINNPFVIQSTRRIDGTPSVGDTIPHNWAPPVAISYRGTDGSDGADGKDGAAGSDGRDGRDGRDGEDAHGLEFIFTVHSSNNLPSNRRPSNNWGFDRPGTINGQTWSDGFVQTTADNPYAFVSTRRITGSPSSGDVVIDNWTIPTVISHFGIDGLAGEDGEGIEFIYTVYSSNSLPSNRRPLNSWGFDRPGTVNGQRWTDGAQEVTDSNRYLLQSTRKIIGVPTAGDAVSDNWTVPVPISVKGLDGRDGEDGRTGTDGNGLEFIFTVYNNSTLPSNRRPLNTWGFDRPGTVNSQRWSDSFVATTADNPYAFVSTRRVEGSPSAGATISDNWSLPVVISHFGIDGLAGEDGEGIEFIYTVYSSNNLPANRRPLNSWGFDRPGTINNQRWTDGAQEVTDSNRFLLQSTRKIIGSPNAGDTVADNWSIPVAISVKGLDGGTGPQGPPGTVPTRTTPITVFIDRSKTYAGISAGTTWSTTVANAATPGNNVVDDFVVQYNNSGTTKWIDSRRWTGSAWVTQRISGDLVVDGTLSTSALISLDLDVLGDAKITGTLKAKNIDSDVFNVKKLSSSRRTLSSSATTIANKGSDSYDFYIVDLLVSSTGGATRYITREFAVSSHIQPVIVTSALTIDCVLTTSGSLVRFSATPSITNPAVTVTNSFVYGIKA